MDAPPIGKQHQPTVSKEFLQGILRKKTVKVRNRVLLAILASTGMRIGELLALQIGPDPSDEITVWDPDARMIRVRKSVWRGNLQDPKTAAAVRDIDLSTPTNKTLQEFTKGRQHGEFLFCTKSGKPLEQSYVSTYILKPAGIPGCHALRRLRVSHLREVGCNEDILKAWLGHSNGSDITNRYSKLTEDLELRRTWAERVGTGLGLSVSPEIIAPRTKKPRKPKPFAEVATPLEAPKFQASDEDLDPFFATPVPVFRLLFLVRLRELVMLLVVIRLECPQARFSFSFQS